MSLENEGYLDELAKQIPAFVQKALTRDEATEWARVAVTTLGECKGDPTQLSTHLVSTILQKLAAQNELEILRRISVLIPRRIRGCRVAIYDWEGRDAQLPRAIIKSSFSVAPDEPTETVDIIRSIRANPQSIRHFAIQAAVRRWEGLVRYNYRLPVHSGEAKVKIRGGGEYNRGVSSRGFWYRIASTHLKRVGEALLEGGQDRAFPSEVSFHIHNMRRLRDQHEYLQPVWHLLAERTIKTKHSVRSKLIALEAALERATDQFPAVHWIDNGEKGGEGQSEESSKQPRPDFGPRRKRVPATTLAAPVLAFLKGSEGRRFLGARGRLRDFRSAFDSWYLNRDPGTLRHYRSRARKGLKGVQLEDEFLIPTYFNQFSLPSLVDLNSPEDWFFPPTVPAEPDSRKR